MNKEYIREIRKALIRANAEIGDALEELQYTEDNGHLDDNIEEIMDMIGKGQTLLSDILEDYTKD